MSRNNRLIERHESGSTVYWKSYDFGGNTGRQNLFAQPLGPGDGDRAFQHDGGEIIFSLPNGLQAYLLADGKGQRIDKGPTAIVSDPRRPDRAVENGLSCMSCHARGIIEKNDQVRAHVLKNAGAFAEGTLETLLSALSAGREDDDADACGRQALSGRGGQDRGAARARPSRSTRWRRASRRSWICRWSPPRPASRPRYCSRPSSAIPHLAKQLGPLRVDGGTVQRQVFVDSFQELVDALELGTVLTSRNLAAEKLIRRGHSFLAKDLAGAMQAYRQRPASRSPKMPSAHAGTGRCLPPAAAILPRRSPPIPKRCGSIRARPSSSTIAAWRFSGTGTTTRRWPISTPPCVSIRVSPSPITIAASSIIAQGELDKAIADYTEALRYEPKSALIFNNRGYAHLEKEELDKAVADFDQAIELEPTFAAAFSNRGLAHLRKNKLGPGGRRFQQGDRAESRFRPGVFQPRHRLHAGKATRPRPRPIARKALELDPALEKD